LAKANREGSSAVARRAKVDRSFPPPCRPWWRKDLRCESLTEATRRMRVRDPLYVTKLYRRGTHAASYCCIN